jgi:hypothetical protein
LPAAPEPAPCASASRISICRVIQPPQHLERTASAAEQGRHAATAAAELPALLFPVGAVRLLLRASLGDWFAASLLAAAGAELLGLPARLHACALLPCALLRG